MTDFAELNSRFAVPGQLQFVQRGEGIVVAELSNGFGSARLALQGAQLLDWTPRGSRPVFWLSEAAEFRKGRAIRGGVPICWPWFGPHESEPAFPHHGFARTQPWQVLRGGALPGGQTELLLRLGAGEETLVYWPHQTPVELHAVLGEHLQLTLSTRNLTPAPVMVGSALHAYFSVGDLRGVRLRGLEGREYLDTLDAGRRKWQETALSITGETDRIYVDTPDQCLIEDPAFGRRIRIATQGSRSTVVWNPWIEKSQRLGDMGSGDYLRMLCVESANAAEDRVRLEPGESHSLTAVYAVEALPER